MSVRYIPDILNGTGAAANFPTTAEFGDYYRLWSRPKTLDMGNFSNEKTRIYPLLQTIRSTHDLQGVPYTYVNTFGNRSGVIDNERIRAHVIIRMQFLEFSYSNNKVEIQRIGSLDLYEYEYETDVDTCNKYHFDIEFDNERIGMVNHLQHLQAVLTKRNTQKTLNGTHMKFFALFL